MPLIMPASGADDTYHVLALPGFPPERRGLDSPRVLIIFIKGIVTEHEVAAFAERSWKDGRPPKVRTTFHHPMVGIESFGIRIEGQHRWVSQALPPDDLNAGGVQHGCILPTPIARLFLAQGLETSQTMDQYTFLITKHSIINYIEEAQAVINLIFNDEGQ